MEFAAAGSTYRVHRPAAREQFKLLRLLLPLLPVLRTVAEGGNGTFGIVAALSSASEADLAAGFEGAFSVCERLVEGQWVPADPSEVGSIPASLEILAIVVSYNFGPYFSVKRAEFQPTWSAAGFAPVVMPDDIDWLYRPILRGLCRAESLTDGTLHIEHFAEMNAVLDAADENQKRAHKAAEAAAGQS